MPREGMGEDRHRTKRKKKTSKKMSTSLSIAPGTNQMVPLNESSTTVVYVTPEKPFVVVPDSEWIPKMLWLKAGSSAIDSRTAPEYRASVAIVSTALATGASTADCAAGMCRAVVPGGALCSTGGDCLVATREYRLLAGSETFRGTMLVPTREMTNGEIFGKMWKPKSAEKTADSVVLLPKMIANRCLGVPTDEFYAILAAVTGMIKKLPPTDVYRVLRPGRVQIGIAAKHLAEILKTIDALPKPACLRLPSRGELKAGCQGAIDSIGESMAVGNYRFQNAVFGEKVDPKMEAIIERRKERERERREARGLPTSCQAVTDAVELGFAAFDTPMPERLKETIAAQKAAQAKEKREEKLRTEMAELAREKRTEKLRAEMAEQRKEAEAAARARAEIQRTEVISDELARERRNTAEMAEIARAEKQKVAELEKIAKRTKRMAEKAAEEEEDASEESEDEEMKEAMAAAEKARKRVAALKKKAKEAEELSTSCKTSKDADADPEAGHRKERERLEARQAKESSKRRVDELRARMQQKKKETATREASLKAYKVREAKNLKSLKMGCMLDAIKMVGDVAGGMKTGSRVGDADDDGGVRTTRIGGLAYTSAEHLLSSLGIDSLAGGNYDKLAPIVAPTAVILRAFLADHGVEAMRDGKSEYLGRMAGQQEVTPDYPIIHSRVISGLLLEIFAGSKNAEVVTAEYLRKYGKVMGEGGADKQ